MTTDPLLIWQDTLARLCAWTPEDDASVMLAELASLPTVKGAMPPELQTLRSLLKANLAPTYVNPSADDAGHPLFALLATQDGHTWPWDDPEARVRELYEADHDEALARGVRWARLARATAPTIHARRPEARGPLEWLETSVCLRQRPHWLGAAVAIGELCAGPMSGTSWAQGWEAACAAVSAKKGAPEVPLKGSRRHRLTIAVAAATARNGVFAGKDASRWQREVNNVDDVSSVTGAMLLQGHAAAAAEVLLAAREKFEAQISYQVWDEARRMLAPPHVDRLSEAARDKLLVLLLDPPKGALIDGTLLEDLVDAGRTLQWVRTHGSAEWEARLLRGRLARAPAVAEAVAVTETDWTQRIRRALSRIDPDELHATPQTARVAAFAEGFTLLSSPAGHGLSWRAVAGPSLRVTGTRLSDGTVTPPGLLPTSPGTVEDVGWIDLTVLAIANGLMFRSAVHKRELDAITQTRSVGADGTAVVQNTQPTRGLRRLVAARWRRTERNGAACWVAQPDATLAIATHVVRRVMRAADAPSAERVMAGLILGICADDDPPYDVGSVQSASERGGDHRLWAHVQDWLPDTALGDVLRRMVEPVAAMESARLQGDHAAVARHFYDALEIPVLRTVRDDICACHEAALRVGARIPRLVEGRWRLGAADAGPYELREWWQADVVPLAVSLLSASEKIAGALHEPADEDGPTRLGIIRDIVREEVPNVPVPVAGMELAERWKAALDALRGLARLQPWHVELALDVPIRAVEAWLSDATRNEAKRTHLTEQLQQAMAQGDEALILQRVTGDESRLLDARFLRSIGHFFLGRLNFGAARAVPARADVPGPLGYFWPLVIGIIGGPLTAIQTNYIWEPVLESVGSAPWKYAVVVVLMYGTCLLALLRDARRRLPEMARPDFLRRCAVPLLVLFAGNFVVNDFVFEVAGRDADVPAEYPGQPPLPAQPHLWTVLLWSSLSMYLGVFFGLMAQGGRLDDTQD